MAAGHFVTNLQFAFDGDIDFHHLDDTGRQVVSALDFFDLIGKHPTDEVFTFPQTPQDLSQLLFGFVRLGQRNLVPARHRDTGQRVFSDFNSLAQQYIPLVVGDRNRRGVPDQKSFELAAAGITDDADLILLILEQLLNLTALDDFGPAVFIRPFAREDTGADHHALDPGWHPQGGVTYITGLFAENGTQQLLFR